MKDRDWPIVVVLSGVPALSDKVNLDPQFLNLMSPYSMKPLDPLSSDLDEIDTAFYHFAAAVGIDVSEVRSVDVLLRLFAFAAPARAPPQFNESCH